MNIPEDDRSGSKYDASCDEDLRSRDTKRRTLDKRIPDINFELLKINVYGLTSTQRTNDAMQDMTQW